MRRHGASRVHARVLWRVSKQEDVRSRKVNMLSRYDTVQLGEYGVLCRRLGSAYNRAVRRQEAKEATCLSFWEGDFDLI